jgi:hypothetical protein
MSLLTDAFKKAFCTERIKPGDTVTCECGQSHKSTEERPLRAGYALGGYFLVDACSCEFAESFGGALWSFRHQIADYFRNMSTALDEDRRRLMGNLMPSLGTEKQDLTGKPSHDTP